MLTHVWVDSVHPTCWTITNNSEGISHIFGCIAKISHLWFNLCMCNPTMEKNSLWLIGESWKSWKIWILLWTCSIVYFGTHDNQKIAHLQIHTDKKNVAIAMVGNFFLGTEIIQLEVSSTSAPLWQTQHAAPSQQTRFRSSVASKMLGTSIGFLLNGWLIKVIAHFWRNHDTAPETRMFHRDVVCLLVHKSNQPNQQEHCAKNMVRCSRIPVWNRPESS